MTTRTAFLFPGQGSQFVGMGKKLVAEHAEAKSIFDEADEALKFKLSQLCFEGPLEELTLTQNTQPAILTHSIALLKVIEKDRGEKPALVAGHSLGEYSALVAAGCLRFSDAVKAVQNRGKWMQEAVPQGEGGMLALVGSDEEKATAFCEEVRSKSGIEGTFTVANLNGGGQVVAAGSMALCQWGNDHAGELDNKPRKVVLLNVSAPFHCAMMKPAEEKLHAHLKTLEFAELSSPYIANVDAQKHSDHTGVLDRLTQQVCAPVRWEASMQTMIQEGECTQFWEVGPGKVLSGLVKRTKRDAVIETLGGIYDVEP